MYVRRPNGQEIQLYPVPTVDAEAATVVNTQTQISNGPPINDCTRSNSLSYVLLIIIAVFVGTAAVVKVRKDKV